MDTVQKTRPQSEIDELMLGIWLENANSAIWRIVDGISALLELDKDELVRYMPKFLPPSLLQDRRHRQDAALAVEDAVERIADMLADHEAWDSYHASRAPSAYRYAAAVASWMYLHSEHLGTAIPLDCPLFSEKVKAAVAEFLATKVARPIAESIPRRGAERCRAL